MVTPVPDDTPLEALPLSARALNCLLVNDCRTAGDVRVLRDWDMMIWPNFGRVSLQEVRDVLATGTPGWCRGSPRLTVRLDPGMVEQLAARSRQSGASIERVALELLRGALG
jgi:DNA-directed RNA polymerase alpha subunit